MKKKLFEGTIYITLFIVWTILLLTVDVRPIGQMNTNLGLSTLNILFHQFTGIHLYLYTFTDILSIIPFIVCISFAIIGIYQLLTRKSIFKVDIDLIILGFYYLIVILCYLFFEKIPINYRPILIENKLEVSYPSSTTLLVLCVMPSLIDQMNLRLKNLKIKKILSFLIISFTFMMIFFRLISGVHWLSDIIGAVLLSFGLYKCYKGINMGEIRWNFMKNFKN